MLVLHWLCKVCVTTHISPFHTFHACCLSVAECSFEESDLCGWSNIAGDNFDWTRDNAGTSSLGTGPRIDHTYGTAAG